MTVVEVYEKLVASRRPIDFFGEVVNVDELKTLYRKFCKIVHPDLVNSSEKYYANEAFVILNRLYDEGLKEFDSGMYKVASSSEEFKKSKPIFQIEVDGKDYSFYEHVASGDIADVYKGVCEGNVVFIKIPYEPSDNDLIDNEYEVLTRVRHKSIPYVETKFSIKSAHGVSRAIISREVEGITCDDLLRQYPNGVPAEHVLWMVERLLSVVGFLHYNCIVHGNIIPNNILINKKNHNVTLFGFSFANLNANEPSAKYKFVNDYYSAPEISKSARVEPSTDIYSIGKIAIKLMGGNVANNGLPIGIDNRVKDFVRWLCKDDPRERGNDAWMLYKRLQNLRTEVYGKDRFKQLK